MIARLLTAILLAVASMTAASVQPSPRRVLILISVDGWRWDYHTRARLPALDRLMARGVRAEGLIPVFPSKTFPNHYTLVTGLYAEEHGIVANSMRDPATGRRFTMSARNEVRDEMWWGGEPLWNTVRRAGRKAAPLFWPGSEAPIGGHRPDYWRVFDDGFPNDERVDQILKWIDLPAAERPDFLTLYFSDVDGAGHAYGPNSVEVRAALERVDRLLGRLVTGLERRGLLASTNLVVVSDHGMAETRPDRVIAIDEILDAADGDIVDLNPTLGIWPRAGQTEAVYRKLAGAHARLRVFRREETPPAWHYRNHARIPPIVGVADEGWTIARRGGLLASLARTISGTGGAHGYDPSVPSMRGIFVAAGPAFRSGGLVVPAFESVHVYLALCQALGIDPAPNAGDPAVARSLLAAPSR